MKAVSGPRRLLVLLLVLGSLGNLGGGTTASFTASTSNPAANFATGTVVLENDVGADDASVCYSTGGGDTDTNVNAACEQLFPVALNQPGDVVDVELDIANVGSLPGTLALYVGTACTSDDDLDADYHGTGDLCDAVQINIQQWTDDTRTTEDTCIFGGGSATVCAFDTWSEVDPADRMTLATFSDLHDDALTESIDLGGRAAGTTRYITVSLAIDQSVTNEYQGLQADWAVTWFLGQVI